MCDLLLLEYNTTARFGVSTRFCGVHNFVCYCHLRGSQWASQVSSYLIANSLSQQDLDAGLKPRERLGVTCSALPLFSAESLKLGAKLETSRLNKFDQKGVSFQTGFYAFGKI